MKYPYSNRALALLLFTVGLSASVSAATLARWDFENGDLEASEQGNFVSTSIYVEDGGPIWHAAGSGVGGGGALGYEQAGAGPWSEGSDVVFFTIYNTHPTEPLQLDSTSFSIGGEGGETHILYFRRNMGIIGDIDDSLPSMGAWTSYTFSIGMPEVPISDLPAGQSFSVGWGLRDQGASNLTTHFLDNILITGIAPVPEPSVALLLVLGVGSFMFKRRRDT